MRATHDRVRSVLHYEPGTGVFTWLITKGPRARVGAVAGSPTPRGYWTIKLDGRSYQAHNLAWFYVTGEWPEHEVDHIDGDPLNNAFTNLRDEPHGVNVRNVVAPNRNNTSGFRGVSESGPRWQANIRVDGKKKYLGTFDTPEEAYAAYMAAKAEHHGEETYRARLS